MVSTIALLVSMLLALAVNGNNALLALKHHGMVVSNIWDNNLGVMLVVNVGNRWLFPVVVSNWWFLVHNRSDIAGYQLQRRHIPSISFVPIPALEVVRAGGFQTVGMAMVYKRGATPIEVSH